jgi:hypothetical protein
VRRLRGSEVSILPMSRSLAWIGYVGLNGKDRWEGESVDG